MKVRVRVNNCVTRTATPDKFTLKIESLDRNDYSQRKYMYSARSMLYPTVLNVCNMKRVETIFEEIVLLVLQ